MSKNAKPGIFQSSFIKAARNLFYNPSYAESEIAQKLRADLYPPFIGGAGDTAYVSTSTAETITAFYNCLKIKAETFASITTGVYRMDEGGRQIRMSNSPLDYILSVKPNQNQNAFDWWFAMQWMEDLHGNSYARIVRDSQNRVAELVILDPLSVKVKRVIDNGDIVYVYKGETIPSYDVIHFKQNSADGLLGRSDVSMNRETFELNKEQEYYARRTFGKKPYGILEDGEDLDPQEAQKLAENFIKHNALGLPPIIYGGLKYKSFALPPGDAQYIESRQFSKAEICAIKRIPLSMLQDYSRQAGATYNNVGEQKASFYTDVILPGSRMKEMELMVKLISRTRHAEQRIKFDYSELMKADPKTMASVAESLSKIGYINRNEGRTQFLGMNPINEQDDPNGNRYLIPANMIWSDQLEGFWDGKKANEGSRDESKFLLNGHAKRNGQEN